MHYILVLLVILFARAQAQPPGDTLRLNDLVLEALRNNPELKAFEYNRDVMEMRVEGTGLLDDPELTYMRDEMRNFRWGEAMNSRIGLMQRIPFPGKLATQSAIAEIQAEHAHHEHMEKANEVLAKLRSAYFELWFAQQSIALNRENARLLQKFTTIAQTRFGVGETPQQDVLKAYVEIARLDNQLVELRRQERTAKAMLRALLARPESDTLGIAVISENTIELPPQDTLQVLARRFRGMLLHDSLSVEEGREMLSLARKGYLPDFALGVEYATPPGKNLHFWTVSATLSLPFTPWGLKRTGARVEEATIAIDRATETLKNARNMVRSNINALYVKAQAVREQLWNYSSVIIPQSERALQASMIAYQTGKTDFLMLIDAYRTLVELSMEKLMLRMQFEQTIAELKREVGYAGIFDVQPERN